MAEEQIREAKELASTGLVTAALGISGFGFDEVLANKRSSFSLLNQSKRRILNEIQGSNGIDYITAMTLERQGELVEDIEGIVDDLDEKIEGMKEVAQATPTRKTDKPNLDQALDGLKEVFASAPQPQDEQQAADALQPLVDRGLISQESLDDYLSRTAITAGQGPVEKRQVIRQLRDRYYTIEKTPEVVLKNITSPDFKLINKETGEEVKDITGLEDGTLNDDGTITLTGLPEGTQQNKKVTIEIQPGQVKKRPNNNSKRKRKDITDLTDKVQDDLSFEVWACLILDIVSFLRGSWDRVNRSVEDMIDALFSQEALGLGKPLGATNAIGALENESFGALADIKENLEDIIGFGSSKSELLGIQESLRKPGLPGSASKTICDFNHEKYCNVHRKLQDFLDSVGSDLDLFEISFGGLPLDDLNFDLKGLIQLLKDFVIKLKDKIDVIDELIDKLAGDVCAFVAQGRQGIPKSLVDISNALADIRNLLSLAPSFNPSDYGILKSAIIAIEISRLIAAGFLAAVSILKSGDLLAFFNLNERSATFEGQIAECLEKAAGKCPDARKASRMRELSRAAGAKADRTVTSQRLREGMRRRRVQNTSARTARNITTESAKLIGECLISDS